MGAFLSGDSKDPMEPQPIAATCTLRDLCGQEPAGKKRNHHLVGVINSDQHSGGRDYGDREECVWNPGHLLGASS